jgi:hypothetical protein
MKAQATKTLQNIYDHFERCSTPKSNDFGEICNNHIMNRIIPSNLTPACSYGNGCKHPKDETMDICGPECAKPIHKACAPSHRCPFHVLLYKCVSQSLYVTIHVFVRMNDT